MKTTHRINVLIVCLVVTGFGLLGISSIQKAIAPNPATTINQAR